MPTIEVRFPSGARTDCVIEAGAHERNRGDARHTGLEGEAGRVRIGDLDDESVGDDIDGVGGQIGVRYKW